MRRRRTRYSEMTSLLDVLFILLFAALIQATGKVSAADLDPADSVPAETPPVDAGAPAPPPVDAGPPPSHVELKRRAVAELIKAVGEREALFARIDAAGVLTAVDRQAGDIIHTTELDTPLVEAVPDPNVELVYIGDRSPELHLCTRLRVILGLSDLAERMVVFVPALALEELPTALLEGLRRDQEHCLVDEQGIGVIVPERGPAIQDQSDEQVQQEQVR